MTNGKVPRLTFPGLIYPGWQAPETVSAFTSTRQGGVSETPYDSLNLGLHVSDNPEHVRQNRQLLPLPSEPCWLNQVHGCEVVEITEKSVAGVTADACFSTVPGVVCAVLTADCLPALLCNRQGTFVSAIHAGWRGLQQNIIATVVQRYPGNPDELLMWLGPCISQTAFEVGEDVKAQFMDFPAAFKSARSPGKYLADLTMIARLQAKRAGIQQVSASQDCTFMQPDKYFSYRRDGETGRMGTFIWIVEQ